MIFNVIEGEIFSMKLLVISPFGTGEYDSTIKQVIDKVKRKDTDITVRHLSRGLKFIRHAYFQMLMTPDVVEEIIKAEADGFDGVFVSCCFEPGVKEAREVVDIPVVGGLLPAVFLARQIGQKFGFITDTPRANAQTYDLCKQYKADVELVGIRSVAMNVESIASAPEKNQEKVVEIIGQFIKDGADVIVNGCTIVAAYFSEKDKPKSLANIPVLDSNVCAIKTLEMLVDLQKKIGLSVSRNIYYQKPKIHEPEAFSYARKIYGLTPFESKKTFR